MTAAMRHSSLPLLVGLALLPLGATATEGGMGRTLTGQQVTSYAGIVPPTPGWVFGVTSVNYKGDMSASREVPIGNTVSAGLDIGLSYNLANVTRVWNTGTGRWNFASAIGLPFQYTQVEVSASGSRRSFGTEDSGTQMSDLLVVPIAAGYHISETDHLSLSLPIYAPTGAYDANRLANAGLNVWTFSPTFAYTRLLAGGAEFTVTTALDIYTRNDDTDFKNGTVFRLEGMWTTALGGGWTLGAVGGWIEQLQDDAGPLAERLGGFKGRAVGAGPILNWSGKFGGQPASLSARWVYEFDVKNRPKGNGIGLNLTLPFM
jgi:hypothetical protein